MKILNSLFLLQRIEKQENLQGGELQLDADHPLYKAHFPGNPITPGACQVQLAQELTELHIGRKVAITKVKGVKYLSMMLPGQGLVEWQASIADGVARYIFSQGGQPVSKIDLQYE